MNCFNCVPFQAQRTRALSRRHARRKGQALVEFALIVTIFLTLLLGMLQFGIYLSATNSLWNLAREGARVASVKSASDTSANQSIKDTIYARTPPNLNTKDMTITIDPDVATKRTAKTQVTVKISYNMESKFFIPMPSALFGKGPSKTYTTYASMMVEGN